MRLQAVYGLNLPGGKRGRVGLHARDVLGRQNHRGGSLDRAVPRTIEGHLCNFDEAVGRDFLRVIHNALVKLGHRVGAESRDALVHVDVSLGFLLLVKGNQGLESGVLLKGVNSGKGIARDRGDLLRAQGIGQHPGDRVVQSPDALQRGDRRVAGLVQLREVFNG